MANSKRIVFAHYSNPGAYPPLVHAVRILADRGWAVTVVGARVPGGHLLHLPTIPSVRYRLLKRPGHRLLAKGHIALYSLAVVYEVIRARAKWLYSSDPAATPAGVFIKLLRLANVVYHEHDRPLDPVIPNLSTQILKFTRTRLAVSADLCVLPQAQRVEAFKQETGRTGAVFCVWNCPSLAEMAPKAPSMDDGLWLYYHGSLNSQRLPDTILQAMSRLPDAVKLRVVGYETIGERGFVEKFVAAATKYGVTSRVEMHGPTSRDQVWRAAAGCHVGLALMPVTSGDSNMVNMVGASNKAFDYLSQGMALVVSDLPQWQETFVDAGYGVACNPQVPSEIASAIRRLAEPGVAARMGQLGRCRILSDWNYEYQFAPVVKSLESTCSSGV